MNILKSIFYIARRECSIVWRSTIYRFCIWIFPVLLVLFFPALMHEGVPENLPVGVVDQDHSATSRAIVRKLDAMQTSQVYAYYNNVSEARTDMQAHRIYSFLLIPEGTEQRLLAKQQPSVSYYSSYTTLTAGSLTYRDIKTACTLAAAQTGIAALAAVGKSNEEIKNNLQPIVLDVHMLHNPYANYNVYLTTYVVPGLLLLFVFLLVPYAIWTEVKFGRSRQWLKMAGNNIHVALFGKLLPHTLMFVLIMFLFQFYIYGVLHFPHQGGWIPIVLGSVLSVLACQGFGIFISAIMPSLRMSMSICSLWAVISLSMCGATFPVEAMDSPLQAISILFPLRHYIVIYQVNIFNGFSLQFTWIHLAALVAFVLLPFAVNSRIKEKMLHSVYIP